PGGGVRFYAFFGILMHTGDALFSAESDVSQRCGPRRSPRSVAVEEVRSKVGLPPVTAAPRAFSPTIPPLTVIPSTRRSAVVPTDRSPRRRMTGMVGAAGLTCGR